MNRLIFYSTFMLCLSTALLLADIGQAVAGSDYLSICLDARATARLKVEACTFASQDKALTDSDRGLAIAHRAMGLKLLKRYDAALKDIEVARRLAPEDADVRRIFADLHGNGMGKAERVVAALNEAAAAQGADPKLLLDRAMAFYRLRDFDRALSDIEQAIALDAKNVEAHRIRGQILSALMRNDEAVLAISEALRLQPGDAWLHMERAGPAMVSGQFAMTRDDLDIALSKDKPHTPFWRMRGAANYALGAFAKAAEDFSQDIKLEPNSSSLTVWRYLADYQGGTATREDAEKLAKSIAGHWPSALLLYFAKEGPPDAAFKEADAIPGLATVRRSQVEFFLGEWEMLTVGKTDQARAHFATVVEDSVVGGYAEVTSLGQPYTINDNNMLEFALARARLAEMAP